MQPHPAKSQQCSAVFDLAGDATDNIVAVTGKYAVCIYLCHFPQFVSLRVTSNEQYFDRVWKGVVEPVNALEPAMMELTEAELIAKTDEFRSRLANGETLEDILVEAFAVVREAARRVLGMRHFDVQLIGGVALHEGAIAEMGTGEGKTLVATLPAYLNALTGKSVHIGTSNDYLAERDCNWMGKVLRFLGLSVSFITAEYDAKARQEAYNSDVVYLTPLQLGFDYLKDSLQFEASSLMYGKERYMIIVDEADLLMIDEGTNPMLLSTPTDAKTFDASLYERCYSVAAQLQKQEHDDGPGDYKVVAKDHTVELLDVGMDNAEKLLGCELWAPELARGFILNACLKAKELYTYQKDYLVRDGEVVIINQGTGRLSVDSRWNDSIHQAIEAKEGVKVNPENNVSGKISYQKLIPSYTKFSGMTGTAETEVEEFWMVYQISVIRIPRNRPSIRIDYPMDYYICRAYKNVGVVQDIAYQRQLRRPVLICTQSVGESLEISQLLHQYGLTEHNLLNARPDSVAVEAQIIAQAGRPGTVTISTSMAGRGTDILLGGNPQGLAADMLERLLVSDLCSEAVASGVWGGLAGSEEAGGRARWVGETGVAGGIPDPDVRLRPGTQRLIEMGRAMIVDETKGNMPEARARAFLQAAMERAESSATLVESGADFEKDYRDSWRWTFMIAQHLLQDTKAQCAEEAAYVRLQGGLHIISTSLGATQRIDNQLLGRAGRQGDPGSTVIFTAFDDEIVKIYGGDMTLVTSIYNWIRGQIDTPESEPINATLDRLGTPSGILEKFIKDCQKTAQRLQSNNRTSVFEADEVLEMHRREFYRWRLEVLTESEDAIEMRLRRYILYVVDEWMTKYVGQSRVQDWELHDLLEAARAFTQPPSGSPALPVTEMGEGTRGLDSFLEVDAEELRRALMEGRPLPAQKAPNGGQYTTPINNKVLWDPNHVQDRLQAISGSQPTSAEQFQVLRVYMVESLMQLIDVSLTFHTLLLIKDKTPQKLIRQSMLACLDEMWRQHLYAMDIMQAGTAIRGYGSMTPAEEFKIEALKVFEKNVAACHKQIAQTLFVTEIKKNEEGDLEVFI
ncbi:hypothetical protein CYMTET_49995 [Cymbomonas tetramitiformis]|uniref:chloroplast protein-transporting ATPase n=1 Tax=Cymbomonas tetramitiformis TaxID=36881 RepID=A0AAE0BQR0_9CHLO|nr:hypothetical protein CYMTET_49995 [Cymbomonas tetramitiformis]